MDAGVSGGLALEHRPALLAALDAIGGGDVLLIAKRDRLGRSVLNVAMIERLVERKGARIVSAAGEGTDDDGPTSVLMRQIVDSFAQYERAVIRSRTRAAMAAKKRRGERAGHNSLRLATCGRRAHPRATRRRAIDVDVATPTTRGRIYTAEVGGRAKSARHTHTPQGFLEPRIRAATPIASSGRHPVKATVTCHSANSQRQQP